MTRPASAIEGVLTHVNPGRRGAASRKRWTEDEGGNVLTKAMAVSGVMRRISISIRLPRACLAEGGRVKRSTVSKVKDFLNEPRRFGSGETKGGRATATATSSATLAAVWGWLVAQKDTTGGGRSELPGSPCPAAAASHEAPAEDQTQPPRGLTMQQRTAGLPLVARGPECWIAKGELGRSAEQEVWC